MFGRKNGNGSNGAHAPDIDSVEWLLVERLELINRRIAELEQLTKVPDDYRDARYRAWLAELSALRGEKASSELELKRERGLDDRDEAAKVLAQERREHERQIINDQIALQRERKQWWIDKLEREGDYTQAKLARMSLLDLRVIIERGAGFERVTHQTKRILPGAPLWLR
jgi:hypothetical protein